MITLLFFYGTLMRGHGRDSTVERAGLRYVGPAKIRGDLFSVSDSFPAFVAGNGEILGEVWEAATPEILRGALHVTDMIEGYRTRGGKPDPSSMYLREEHPLLDDEDGRTVLVYRWNTSAMGSHLRRISSGDWREYSASLVKHRRSYGGYGYGWADDAVEDVDDAATEPDWFDDETEEAIA